MRSSHVGTGFVFLVMFSLCLASSPVMVRAAGPGIITYQGALTTPDGEPQASGAYNFCIGGPDSFTQNGSPTVVSCIEDGSPYSPSPSF